MIIENNSKILKSEYSFELQIKNYLLKKLFDFKNNNAQWGQ
jgi:hypothetical protein